jgi:hypothetical protein
MYAAWQLWLPHHLAAHDHPARTVALIAAAIQAAKYPALKNVIYAEL